MKIETSLSVIEGECNISESPFNTSLPSSLNLTTSPQKHEAVSENLGHVEYVGISVIEPVVTHVVDTITTVESVTCDKETDPITQDKVTEVSVPFIPPPASDSGVPSHHQPDFSGVPLHSGPPNNEVCLPVPVEPSDMQVLPNTNTKSGTGVYCPCCNQTMTISHACFEEIGYNNSDEIPPLTPPSVPTIEKNNMIHE